MSPRRGKRTTLICLAVAVGILATWAAVSRERIEEVWCIWRLSSTDIETRRTAIRGLAECGGDLCVPKLLPLLEQQELLEDGIPCLGEVGVRASPAKREAIVRRLIEPGGSKEDFQLRQAALEKIARSSPDSHRALVAFLSPETTTPQSWLAAHALAAAVETLEESVADLLEEADVRTVRRFFLDLGTPSGVHWADDPQQVRMVSTLYGRNAAGMQRPLPTDILAIAEHLLEHHPDEQVRALAVSFQVVTAPRAAPQPAPRPPLAVQVRGILRSPKVTWNPKVLASAWARDPSPVVRTTCARLAGFLGHDPETLDLPALLLSVEDPGLLTEVIQARTLWTTPHVFQALELWDGLLCNWIPDAGRPPRVVLAWEPRELARLEEIIGTSRAPELRDAASLALASRYRQPGPDLAKKSPVASGLKVHEWGVWRDDQGLCVPAGKVLAELPGFVHRSAVSVTELWDARSVDQSIQVWVVTKPVIFFHTPHPQSLLVSVGFHEGRPWTYYPRATDFTLTRRSRSADSPLLRAVSSSGQSSQGSRTPIGPGRAALEDLRSPETSDSPTRVTTRDGFQPPWARRAASREGGPPGPPSVPKPSANPVRPTPDDLYDFVPWVSQEYRASRPSGMPVLRGSRLIARPMLGSVNLEWCGLRVGYDPALEGPLPVAPPDHWWSLLRKVGASPVAIRGEQERFLFYDGSVHLPAPVAVSWMDTSRRELSLRLLPFEAFPRHPARDNHGPWFATEGPSLRQLEKAPLPAVIIVRVDDTATVRGRVLEDLLPSGGERIRVPIEDLPLEGTKLEERFLAVLMELGLFRTEASSLLETWRPEFLETSGVRVLTVLPQWMVDAVLPLRVRPVPEDIARAGIVWAECRDSPVGKEGVKVAAPGWSPTPWTLPETGVRLSSEPWGPGPTLKLEGKGKILVVPLEGKAGPVSACGEARRLAFGAIEDSTYRVLLADLDRQVLQVVARIEDVQMFEPSAVSLAPDGRLVAFGYRKDGEPRGRLVDLESHHVADLGNRWPLDISSDGRRLLCAEGPWAEKGRRLVVLDRSTGRSRTVLEHDGQGLLFRDAVLSGDGTRVAFTTRVEKDHDVFLVDLEKSTIRNVSLSTGEDWEPSISPDGSRLLFRSDRDPGQGTYLRSIYVTQLEAGWLLPLTSQVDAPTTPRLLPGGRFAFLEDPADGSIILDVDTGRRHAVPTEPGASIAVDDRGSRAVVMYLAEGKIHFQVQKLHGSPGTR